MAEIRGITLEKAQKINALFQEQHELRKAMLFLQDFGVTPAYATKIYKRYKDKTFDIIKNNPYRIADDIFGIGFKMADKMASAAGIPFDSPYRICAGIKFVLNQALGNGHVYLPITLLTQQTEELLQLYQIDIEQYLKQMQIDNQIWLEKREEQYNVYLAPFYYAEIATAKKLLELSQDYESKNSADIENAIKRVEEQTGMTLAEQQKQAVIDAMTNGVLIITGGPGTGKTTTINTIIQILKEENYDIVLAAPTGRAAKRMTEATGMEVKVEPGTYLYVNRRNNTENYWFLPEDLDMAENTDTGIKKGLIFAGTVESSSFFYDRGQDGNASYILNDEDFAELKKGLSNKFQMTQVLFNVSDAGDTYAFSKELYARYCKSVPDSMRVMAAYDEYREGVDAGYDYGGLITLYPKRPEIEVDWKYSPVFVPLLERSFVLTYATLLLIFVFVSVICLVSAGVIGYTRSITVAVKSKRVLMDVKKLGVGQEYLNRILKEQIKKIFVLPTAAATILMFIYYTMILWQNDGVISSNEYPMIGFNIAVCLIVVLYQYTLYCSSFRKSQMLVFGAGTAVMKKRRERDGERI